MTSITTTHAEIVAIGSELLLGVTLDTNSAAIAKKLQSIGIPLYYTSTVGDDLDRLVSVLRLAQSRSTVVITTGGLGPTVDDLTREAVALAYAQNLAFDETAYAQIEARFRRRGRPMSENNRRQAYRPERALLLENPVGTAPCFILEEGGGVLISLPGVPREMEWLMDQRVLPFLQQRYPAAGIIKIRELKTSGMGESQVDALVGDLEKLANPVVGLNAHSGIVVIRMTATAANAAAADGLLAPVEAEVRKRLGNRVFGMEGDSLEGKVLEALHGRQQRLAVVESGTGGRLSGKLSALPPNPAYAGSKIMPSSATHGAEPARQIAGELAADWGLACQLRQSEAAAELDLSLWNARHSVHYSRSFGGHPALAPEWAANVALDALRQTLLAAAEHE